MFESGYSYLDIILIQLFIYFWGGTFGSQKQWNEIQNFIGGLNALCLLGSFFFFFKENIKLAEKLSSVLNVNNPKLCVIYHMHVLLKQTVQAINE